MAEQKSFKERVKETVIHNAYFYKMYYVEYEYLLCSKAFIKNGYYIVSAYEDNYLHLTGLHTSLDAATFFEKCYKGTSVEEDFEKNRIRCAMAASNSSATLGFVVAGKAKPMTLLKGNELNMVKAKKLDLVLRRKVGETKFSEVLLGDETRIS